MSFEALGLTPELSRGLHEKGYTVPTPVQAAAIPLALQGRDVVGSAQTGTGKTAAFLLPILQLLGPPQRGAPRALVLVPTRELADQVWRSAQAYGRPTRLKSIAIYGGVGIEPQRRALRSGVDIVVATPGRLLDHLERRQIDLSRIEMLVLDEADRMLDMGFAPDVSRILKVIPADRQSFFFSATISGDVDRLARQVLTDPAEVEIGHRAETAEGIEHRLFMVDRSQKRDLLRNVLAEEPLAATIVFTRTKHGADKLAKHLKQEGRGVVALHGGKTQSARTRALADFKRGGVNILVATDVAARGVDVANVARVVNFDVPTDPEAYVHRVGRTARAGASGIALTLMSPEESTAMRDVEKFMGRTFARSTMPGFEPAAQSRVAVATAALPRRQNRRSGSRRRLGGPR